MSSAFSSANPSFPFFDDGLTPEELSAFLSHTDLAVRSALAGITSAPSAHECLSQGDAYYKLYQSLPGDAPPVGKVSPKKQHLQQAIAHYRKALELKPDLADAYIKLAQALWTEGHIGLETTLHYCELAIRHDPGTLSHYLAYSDLLSKAEQYHQADAVLSLATPLALQGLKGFSAQKATQWAWQRAVTRWDMVGHPSTEHTAWETRLAISLSSVVYGSLGLPHYLATGMGTRQANPSAGVTDHEKTTPPGLPLWTAVQGSLSTLIAPLAATAHGVLAQASQSIGHTTLATQCWQRANHWQPNQITTLKALSTLAKDAGQTDQALRYTEQLLTLSPNEVTLHLRAATLYKDTQNLEQARHVLEKATAIAPSNGQLFFELGQVLSDQQQYLQALVALKEANRLEAHHPYILANMAYVLFKLDDMSGAVSCYRQALEMGTDPVWRSAVAQTLGALYYQFHQDDVAAQESLEMAIRLDPSNAEAQTMLAELLFETGQMHRALEMYETLSTLKPHDADIHSHKGYILWQMDRNEEALDAYQLAIHCDSKNAIVYNNMGVIYLDELYDGQKASNLFDKALICNPQYTLAAFNLGRSYELLGQTHDAAKAYSQALALVELNPELDKADITDRLHLLFSV
ncbi:MAG: tetratricopeptide repeat protein [Vampirovibrionales bacterium]|nr:tetratricopeptide repeat protein [Vampirovibrionales bacterium]